MTGRKEYLPDGQVAPDNTNKKFLKDTQWENQDGVAVAMMPDWILFYRGQKLSNGELHGPECLTKLTKLGIGYKTWVKTLSEASGKLDCNLTIVEEITTDGELKLRKYVHKNCGDTTVNLSTNGPSSTIANTHIQRTMLRLQIR